MRIYKVCYRSLVPNDKGVISSLMYYERWQKRNKYNATSCMYGGNKYHSKAEAEYAMFLDAELRDKRIKQWGRQVKIPLVVKGYHIANYYIDFIVYHNDGTKEYVEVKGFETELWRIKWKIFEALYDGKKNTKLSVVKTGAKYNVFKK